MRAPDHARAVSALSVLPQEQRIVVELSYFSGLSSREIAERTGVAVGTVKSRMAAAMRKLRIQLSDGAQSEVSEVGQGAGPRQGRSP